MSQRGRPAGVFTHRRRQVLASVADRFAQGERVSLSEVARACGLYDYREARRIVGDLKKMGAI